MGYYIYPGDVEKLEGREPFRDDECVALVQETTRVGHTSHWRPGPRVVDLSYLNPGTMIANFVFDKAGRGRFPNKHGYHAALFMAFRRNVSGSVSRIQVMDQWTKRRPNLVLERFIESRGKSHAEGNPYADADNADQFYVVVRE
ncbi:MAG: BPSL0067 family protein [Janthinobacterium lividum]